MYALRRLTKCVRRVVNRGTSPSREPADPVSREPRYRHDERDRIDRKSEVPSGANAGTAKSEPELILDDAEPDLSRVDRHLLTDEGVLGPRVHVAERAFEASALAD